MTGRTYYLLKSFVITVLFFWATISFADPPTGLSQDELDAHQEAAQELISQRQQLDQLLWQPEIQAQKYESRFVELWDQLRLQEDKFGVLASFPFKRLILGKYVSGEPLDLNIARYKFTSFGQELVPEQWKALLLDAKSKGYELIQTEWHHSKFDPPSDFNRAKSEINFVLHIARDEPAHRIIIQGVIEVIWEPEELFKDAPEPEMIVVKEMELLEREKPPVFKETFKVKGNEQNPRVLPLAVYDLDGDGLSEIVLGGQNLVIRNQGEGKLVAEQFLRHETSIFDAAILADFTGDGPVDFIAVDEYGALRLFVGDAKGRFLSSGIRISDDGLFSLPKVFTAGDIDADGDLDLYIANYKFAYRQGQWPTPYFDANDGYPAYMLRNDGEGNFSDITEESGLADKRFRRAYSGSLVDLDNDLDLDLIVVSDFAGFDTYLNDGKGNFNDITNRFGDDRYFFGMGLTFADYNLDGDLDFYVIGMSSTTAKRLEDMGIVRDDKPEHNAKRAAMGYGNRMFLGGEQEFARAPFNHSVARTGWSWGASSFDFDNDGDRDIFVANGHYSGKSAQDYCTTFWRHDIYADGSEENLTKDILFQTQSADLRNADVSWNGFEHKVMLMNQDGEDFVNIAFLLGVAFEYDGRAVVADDIDGDGRVDLLVVEYKTQGHNNDTYTLHVYQNQLNQVGNWIGIRLPDEPDFSPIGAVVKINTDDGTQMDQIVTGDSFSSQHPATVHFGIGNLTNVNSIEVRWANGTIKKLQSPETNRYHVIHPL